MPPQSPLERWALTPPFHLFPPRQVESGSFFSVALSVADAAVSTFPLGSTMLCVARTFLPDIYNQDDKTACINAKVNGF